MKLLAPHEGAILVALHAFHGEMDLVDDVHVQIHRFWDTCCLICRVDKITELRSAIFRVDVGIGVAV